ncbi:hypothetical protein OIDMADRAFT_197413 [Oidiodendron maius Zn]|uniref:Domain of unknown function at the cortex 1 domain-containing protein n=1 Tax=Oidiodendron maius (strain Zn) TaxID=913774 RepID=A0A0C3HGQ4_OIDMZ|nr:hypothetical protein OIDMADRAFT_197413 [Oidiodendron maius Zn]
MAHNYILRVTAGPANDPKLHKVVPVNSPVPLSIESDLIDIDLNVRIQNYKGLPRGSPETSAYFDIPPHAKNKDQYSICFRFTLKEGINGNDLVFGNDFDHPIRDRLPPGFGTAFKIVKWAIDPGLDGDPYADEPYLYGPTVSSMNTIYIGPKTGSNIQKSPLYNPEAGLVFDEGGSEEGMEIRRGHEIPDTEAARKRFFLDEENKRNWEWESGRTYAVDFFNPYLDFSDFALRLPGFTLPIMKYWDGQGLRYVLKNRKTNAVLLAVLFTLYLDEDLDEEGNVKPGLDTGLPFDEMDKVRMERDETKSNDSEDGSSKEGSVKGKKTNGIAYDDDDDVD